MKTNRSELDLHVSVHTHAYLHARAYVRAVIYEYGRAKKKKGGKRIRAPIAGAKRLYLRLRIASNRAHGSLDSGIRASRATRCIISEAMHARVQWKVHRRNVIIIVARFAYVTGWLAGGDEGSAGRSVGWKSLEEEEEEA